MSIEESDDSLQRGELVDGVQKTAGVGCREGQQRGTIRSCKGTAREKVNMDFSRRREGKGKEKKRERNRSPSDK